MPYDLHPFLIFATSCQLRQKGPFTTKQFDRPSLQAAAAKRTLFYSHEHLIQAGGDMATLIV